MPLGSWLSIVFTHLFRSVADRSNSRLSAQFAYHKLMPIPNLFTDDLIACQPAELEQAIIQLAQSGVEEKFRLDFKETWKPDERCQDVSALANSYGGLLIVGVSDDRQRFPGIPIP